MMDLPDTSMSGLGETSAPLRLPFLTFAMVGAAIGALRAKEGHMGEGALKGAAVGVVAEVGLGILLIGSFAGYVAYKFNKLPPGAKAEVNRQVDSGEFKAKVQQVINR